MKNEFTLTNEIIALSESKIWEKAKREWSFTHAFQRPNSSCLCGKQGIINVCVISNWLNGKQTEVGNCCVKKFMDMNEGDAVFNSLNKLKTDIESNITADGLEMIYDAGKITEWEYDFYLNVMKKRKKLTEKQMNCKLKVNHKFIEHYMEK